MANKINPETIITSVVTKLVSQRYRNMSDRLWGKMLSHFPVIRADLAGINCSTMCIDGKNIYYNPNFVRDICLDAIEQNAETLLSDRLKFLLAHEIMHVIYRNVAEKRSDVTYAIPGPRDKAYKILHDMANGAWDAVINARLEKEFGENKVIKSRTKRDKNGNRTAVHNFCFYEGEIEKAWTQLFIEVCNKMNAKMARELNIEINEYPGGFFSSIDLFRKLYPRYDEQLNDKKRDKKSKDSKDKSQDESEQQNEQNRQQCDRQQKQDGEQKQEQGQEQEQGQGQKSSARSQNDREAGESDMESSDRQSGKGQSTQNQDSDERQPDWTDIDYLSGRDEESQDDEDRDSDEEDEESQDDDWEDDEDQEIDGEDGDRETKGQGGSTGRDSDDDSDWDEEEADENDNPYDEEESRNDQSKDRRLDKKRNSKQGKSDDRKSERNDEDRASDENEKSEDDDQEKDGKTGKGQKSSDGREAEGQDNRDDGDQQGKGKKQSQNRDADDNSREQDDRTQDGDSDIDTDADDSQERDNQSNADRQGKNEKRGQNKNKNTDRNSGDASGQDEGEPEEESKSDRVLREIAKQILGGDSTIDDHDKNDEIMKENDRTIQRKIDRVMQDVKREMEDIIRQAGSGALGTSILIDLCNKHFRPKPEPWYVGISLLLKSKIQEGRQIREKVPPIEMLTQVMTGNSVIQFEKADRRLDIAFAVDVSGSMDNDDVLSGVLKILAYLERNIPKGSQGHRFIFCQVDAGVEEWKEMRIPSREYSQWKKELAEKGFVRRGSGGTEFAPFFRKIADMKKKPDATIVFSDMYLYDYPEVEKAMEKFKNNVIWLCSNEEVPKDFYNYSLGRVYETSSLFDEPEISR